MYIVLALLVITPIGWILLGMSRSKKQGGSWNTKEGILNTASIIPCILLVIIGIAWVSNYLIAIDTYGRLLAYKEVIVAYDECVVITSKDAIVRDDIGSMRPSIIPSIDIQVENLRQSTNTSDRVREMRDYVKEYHTVLNQYKSYKAHWLTSQFLPPIPKELLEPLV